MWLVLCNDDDGAAHWAWSGLVLRGLAPIELVTAQALSNAQRWAHHVDDQGAWVEMTLADGRSFDSRQVHGVLNRLLSVWNAWTPSAAPGDQQYAAQEFYAFVVSWLHCLPGPVLNRPSFLGPGGQWRHDAQWAVLAAQAGLAVPPYHLPAPAAPVDERAFTERHSVVVLGAEVFGGQPQHSVEAGCARLAELSGTELLGVDFSVDSSGRWLFRSATPRPDLAGGGDALLDALAQRLALVGAATR